MQALRSAEMLEIWDRGRGRHPVDRALVVLGFACRDRDWEGLCALPIGERNRLLLGARAATFGPRLDMVVTCPACRAALEFDFTIPLADFASVEVREVEAELGGGALLRLRLPNSRDLAAVAHVSNMANARHLLVSRCALEISRPGALERAEDTAGGELEGDVGGEVDGEALVAAVSNALERHDPLAVIAFPVTCVDCGHAWRATLDPVDYTWRQISQHVAVIVREVHTLAQAYGWSEAEVLGMSPERRRLYIEQVGG